jgi:hypothetical protein
MHNAPLAQSYICREKRLKMPIEPHIPAIYEQSAADPYFMPRMWVGNDGR